MEKSWLSYDEQLELLVNRGMRVDDPAVAINALSEVNYYRLSGYFRYWQRNPESGDSTFLEGTSFEPIYALYQAEQNLANSCKPLLMRMEVILKTRFAYYYGHNVGPVATFAYGKGFTQPTSEDADRVEEHILANLDRSREPFIAHHRDEIKQGRVYKPQAYDRLPIWVAVEALTFGSLSRLIEASSQSGVLDDLADSLGTSRKLLPGQVKSFVYLRNRVAHCARLWNHSVLEVPGIQPNTSRRIQRQYHAFDDHSVYKIFVALHDLAKRSGLHPDWLPQTIEPLLDENPLLAYGITKPVAYGRVPHDVLL